jgi:ABC-type phosphate transport system substrate-binding protein
MNGKTLKLGYGIIGKNAVVMICAAMAVPAIAYGGEGVRIQGTSVWGGNVIRDVCAAFSKADASDNVRNDDVICDEENAVERFRAGKCDILVRTGSAPDDDVAVLGKGIQVGTAQPTMYVVGYAKVLVIVNRANAVHGMTLPQMRALLSVAGKGMKWPLFGSHGGEVTCYGEKRDGISRSVIRRACMMVSGKRLKGSYHVYRDDFVECADAEDVIRRVQADANGIGFILYDGHQLDGVKVLAIGGGASNSLVEVKEGKFIQEEYPLTQPVLLYLHPNAPTACRRLCEWAMGEEGSEVLCKDGLLTPHQNAIAVAGEHLAEMRAGKGVRLVVLGYEGGRIVMAELAPKYVRAKTVIQVGYSPLESDVAAVGAFVLGGAGVGAPPSAVPATTPSSLPSTQPTTAPASVSPFIAAGGKEALFLADKPSDKAMQVHGAKWNELSPAEYLLAGRAVAIIVNPANKLESLTLAQVRSIFGGEVDDWAIVGGTGLGGAASVAPAGKKPAGGAGVPIHAFGLRDNVTGGIFFKECLPAEKLKKVTFKKDTAETLAAVSMDTQAIAFVDLAAIPPTGQSVKVLGIQMNTGKNAGETPATRVCQPTAENIKNAMYPLSQRLYLYVHPKASETAKDFAKFIATCGGSEASPYADTVKSVMETYRKNGLIPLADAAIERAAKDAAAAAKAKEPAKT